MNDLTKEQQFKRNQIIAQIAMLVESQESAKIEGLEMSPAQELAIDERLKELRECLTKITAIA